MNKAIRCASWLLASLSLLLGPRLLADSPPGLVLAWGGNSYGQAVVPTGLTNVLAISAGYFHSLAVRSDTTVAAWGQWYSGSSTYTTVTVPSSLTNVVAVAGGLSHSVALRKDGTVVAWGYGYFNQTNVPAGL